MDPHKGSQFVQTSKQTLISSGNETFDKFLGGGLLRSSLNLFERSGPSSKLLDPVLNKSFAATTLLSKSNLLFIDFNTAAELDDARFLSKLPFPRKIKSELLYKDVRGRSASAKIKIAWRYSSRVSDTSDEVTKMHQVDFGLPLTRETRRDDLGTLQMLGVDNEFDMSEFFRSLDEHISKLGGDDKTINIIIQNLMHPFSPMVDKSDKLLSFICALRCRARTLEKGAILVSYDRSLCSNYASLQTHLYNLADCVVCFNSYETGQNKIIGYKNADGTLEYIKVPKINSFGFHFQPELSDWGYRFTKNHRFFVIDELTLPPCHDDEDTDKIQKQTAADLTNIGHKRRPLEQVGPLEEFREVAEGVISKRL